MRDSANANKLFDFVWHITMTTALCQCGPRQLLYNHADIYICWHYRGRIFCHLPPGKEIKKKKEQETREAWHSRAASVFSLGIIGQRLSALSQVRNVSPYDKDSVRKWLRFQLFQEGKSTLDRVEWSRNLRFKFLHSVSKQRIPSGYWFSFEWHRESHCSQCTNHVGGKHLLVSMQSRFNLRFLCWRYP